MFSRNYKVLIIDDDPEFHQQIRFAFRRNFEFEGVVSFSEVEAKIQTNPTFDLILLDLLLDKNSKDKIGFDLIPKLQRWLPSVPIVVVTNEPSIYNGVEALKRGAADFLYKGQYDFDYWNTTFARVLEKTDLKAENKQLKKELEEYKYDNPPEIPLIGESAKMERLRKMLKIMADDKDTTVLITGETGVGKGVAARFLHYNSLTRRDQPFEEIHISNISKSLLESQLFGAKKGSYTDAKEDVKGRLHLADKGIVFLDEIGELDLENQVKLLQFLQSKTIRPMGATKDILLDVQIVAATNKDLRTEIAKGNFREDLYQRLNVFPIEIPPLRDRRDDIPALIQFFLKLSNLDLLDEIMDPQVKRFFLEEYDWVGNVRELENALRSSMLQRKVWETDKITWQCLPEDMRNFHKRGLFVGEPHAGVTTTTSNPNVAGFDFKKRQAYEMLEVIENALNDKNGVKKDAAELLDMTSDDLLYRVKNLSKKYPDLISYFPRIKAEYKFKQDQSPKI
jgi:DNA-binding NtrC family response regulator